MQRTPILEPPPTSAPPPFRRLYFLTLIFLALPFAYTYGFRLHSSVFVDLSSFYYGAQTAFRHHQSPYAPGALAWGARATHAPVWPYLYPPPTLLLFSPFAHMSYKAAKLLVLTTNQVCILGLLFLLLHLLGLTGFLRPRAAPDAAAERGAGGGALQAAVALVLTAYLFLFQPLVVGLMLGQINVYVIVLLCLTWYALRQDAPPALAALPFALAVVLKTYPLLFLPILIIKGKWRIASWALGFLALLSALSYFVLPRAVWHDWLTFVLPYGGYTRTPPGLFPPSAVWNQSVNGFASRLFFDPQTAALHSPVAARVLAYSLCAGLFGTELLLSWRLRAAQKRQREQRPGGPQTDGSLDLEFGLFLLTMYLIAPLSWEHHLVFVLPAVFLALARVLSFREDIGTTAWAAAAAFLIAWTVPMGEASWQAHFFHLLLSIKFYAVLALWLFFAVWLAQRLRTGGSAPAEEAPLSRP